MNIPETDERAFEKHIELALVGSTLEDRAKAGTNNIDEQHPADDKFYWGQPKDMDKTLALDLRRLWSFLKTTQQSTRSQLLQTVQRAIDSTLSTSSPLPVSRHFL